MGRPRAATVRWARGPGDSEPEPSGVPSASTSSETYDRVQVCMLLSSFHPVIGGTQSVVLRLCSELIERATDPVVLTRRYPGLSRFETVRGVPVHRLGFPSHTKLGALSYALHALWLIAWRLREHRILHAHSPDTPLLVGLLARLLLRRRLFISVRSTPSLILGDGRATASLRIRLMGRLTDGIGVLSPAIARELIERGVPEGGIVSLPNGVDTERFSPPTAGERLRAREELTISAETIVYLFVGRLVALKAVDVLLRAWARGQDDQSRMLLIVGGGEEAPRLQEMAERLGLQNVRFAGPVDDVLPHLHAADAFVLPSRIEGLSNALLEAMAVALPPIVSDLPVNRAVVESGDNGLLFPKDDVSALARCLSTLESAERRRRLGGRAAETARARFSLDSAVERHRRLYLQAARKSDVR